MSVCLECWRSKVNQWIPGCSFYSRRGDTARPAWTLGRPFINLMETFDDFEAKRFIVGNTPLKVAASDAYMQKSSIILPPVRVEGQGLREYLRVGYRRALSAVPVACHNVQVIGPWRNRHACRLKVV